MSSPESGKQKMVTSKMRTVRELALLADLASWAGEQDRCVAIIACIYDVCDALEQGLVPDVSSRVLAADAAFWVGDRERCAALITEALN